jgi:hypothetical protein
MRHWPHQRVVDTESNIHPMHGPSPRGVSEHHLRGGSILQHGLRMLALMCMDNMREWWSVAVCVNGDVWTWAWAVVCRLLRERTELETTTACPIQL